MTIMNIVIVASLEIELKFYCVTKTQQPLTSHNLERDICLAITKFSIVVFYLVLSIKTFLLQVSHGTIIIFTTVQSATERMQFAAVNHFPFQSQQSNFILLSVQNICKPRQPRIEIIARLDSPLTLAIQLPAATTTTTPKKRIALTMHGPCHSQYRFPTIEFYLVAEQKLSI